MSGLDRIIAQMRADDEAADSAPIEQWERCGELLRDLDASAAMDVAGCNSAEAYPKACIALAAATDGAESIAWRELALMPRNLVLHVSRAVSKRSAS